MKADEFRALVESMLGVVAGAHMGHADFRVGNRIFATVGYPDECSGMVKLNPEQQEMVLGAHPDIFKPANGAWGRRGSTLVLLDRLDAVTAQSVVRMAWDNLHPAKGQSVLSRAASRRRI